MFLMCLEVPGEGLTNRGCLHCAITQFSGKKSPQIKEYTKFPSRCSKQDFQHEIHQSSLLNWQQKHQTRNVLILSLLLVIIMVLLLKVFKVGPVPSRKRCFISFNESLLKIMKNAFYFISKAFLIFVLTFWPCKKTRLD